MRPGSSMSNNDGKKYPIFLTKLFNEAVRRVKAEGGRPGFTIIEAVLALTVFAVLGAALMAAGAAGFTALQRAHADMVMTTDLCLAEKALRDNVADVRFPFWLSAIPESDDDDSFSVPYYQGDKDRVLNVTYEEDRLRVSVLSKTDSTIQSQKVFTGFAKMTWDLLKTEKEEPWGASFTLVPAGAEDLEIKVIGRFGSSPTAGWYE